MLIALINAKKLASVAKEFSNLATSYENAIADENLKRLEAKFEELEKAFGLIKS